jgi:hypothetical protein
MYPKEIKSICQNIPVLMYIYIYIYIYIYELQNYSQ